MKKWHTAKELLGLDEMPETISGVVRKAKRDCYIARFRQGQGGGKEYHISTFPEKTKDHLHRNAMKAKAKAGMLVAASSKELAKIEPRELQNLTELKNWQREIFDAKLVLYNEFKQLKKLYGTTKAITKLVTMAKTETLPELLQNLVPLANARRGQKGRTLSKSTIQRWDREVKKYGVMALVPSPVKESKIPDWAPFFIKCYGLASKPSLSRTLEKMAEVLPEGMPLPSYHQVRRFHNKRSRLDREKGRRTGSELKAIKGHRQRDTSDILPMEIGTCDGHSFKARVAHPITGNPFKPEICTVADVACRMIMGWSVGLAESAITVGGAVRHAATVNETKPYGGVFSILYTDGGSGNKAKVLTDDFVGVLPRIGTTHKTGIPGNAQGHGLIERINSSVWIPAAKELPTFVGKDMDSLTKRNMTLLVNREIKKNGVSKHLPTWPQFLAHCTQTVDAYNNRPHSALPKITDPETGRRRHISPLEMWALHIKQGWDHKECQLTEQEIEILFLPRIKKKVRRASVKFIGNTYYNKILEHFRDEEVQVAYDIHNAEKVQIWDTEGRMICYAMFDKNKDSYFPRTFIDKTNDDRAKRRAQIKIDNLADIEAERQGIVDVVPVDNVIDIAETSIAIKADKEALCLEMKAKSSEVVIPNDDKGKFNFWHELDTRLSNSGNLTVKEMVFYEAYRKSASYRAFEAVAKDFAQQMQQ